LFDKDRDLISRCLQKDRAAEKQLYHRFAPIMFGVCLRYGGNEMEAEDILQNGFIRLFSHLHQFRFKCDLENWVHPIFVTTAINYYRQQLKFNQQLELDENMEDTIFLNEDAISLMSKKELLAVIHRLPVGYRTVFNMYIIEGYDHKEIASLLRISEGTSKSQLHRAKISVRRMLKEIEN